MRIIKSMLKEELENSLNMQKSYQREIAKLPKGSLVQKNVNGHKYYYIVFREAGKVKLAYKGNKITKAEIEKYKLAKIYRAKYRKLLSEINKQIKFLRSTLRGKQPV